MQGNFKRLTRKGGPNNLYLEPGDIITTDNFEPITPPAISGANGIIPGKEQTDEVLIQNLKREIKKLAVYGVKVKVFRQDSLVTGRTDDIITAADEL